jgi:hypothetical protein
MNKNNNSNSGIGCGGVLFLIFLVLKLTGLINWSWWWVTSPLWIGAIFIVSLIVLLAVFDN